MKLFGKLHQVRADIKEVHFVDLKFGVFVFGIVSTSPGGSAHAVTILAAIDLSDSFANANTHVLGCVHVREREQVARDRHARMHKRVVGVEREAAEGGRLATPMRADACSLGALAGSLVMH